MHPSDALIGIGYHMPDGKRGFTYKVNKFNSFFFQKKSKYPLILGRIMFNWDGAYPKSEELGQSLSVLTLAGMLHFSFATPNYYQFDPAVKVSYETRISKRMSHEQKKDLEKIARKFEAEFGVKEKFRLD